MAFIRRRKRSLRGCTSTLKRWPSIHAEECTKTFDLSFISELSGVRILHATFDSHISVCRDKDILIFWHRMRALPLRHVTVVVPDTAIPWSVGKRNTAEDLRSLLLGPNGPEVLGIVKELREAEDEGFGERYQAVKAARRALPESIVRS